MGRWYNTTFMGLMVGGGEESYAEKVLGYGPLAYWPLWEAAGGVANCLVNPLQDGAYTGVTLGQPGIGDGNTAPYFDGANDYVDVFSAALAGVFNGATGTLSCWAKVFNVGVWTDATFRTAVRIGADGNNYVHVGRSNGNGDSIWIYKAGGVTEADYSDFGSPTTWMHLLMTWDQPGANEVEMFYNALSLNTYGALGVWAGNLAAGECHIGVKDAIPTNPWYGYLAHVALFDSVLGQPAITDLATV